MELPITHRVQRWTKWLHTIEVRVVISGENGLIIPNLGIDSSKKTMSVVNNSALQWLSPIEYSVSTWLAMIHHYRNEVWCQKAHRPQCTFAQVSIITTELSGSLEVRKLNMSLGLWLFGDRSQKGAKGQLRSNIKYDHSQGSLTCLISILFRCIRLILRPIYYRGSHHTRAE
jgi:hypothetical protein